LFPKKATDKVGGSLLLLAKSVVKKGINDMKQLSMLISLSAICIIFYALFRVIILNKKIPGGIVKEYWRLFYYLIGLLAIGYMATLLFATLPDASKELIAAIISLAGAIFVVKVVNLFFKIIKNVGL
jgi:hypothetical protein